MATIYSHGSEDTKHGLPSWNISPQIGIFVQGSCFSMFNFFPPLSWLEVFCRCLVILVCSGLRMGSQRADRRRWGRSGDAWGQERYGAVTAWGCLARELQLCTLQSLSLGAGQPPDRCALPAASIMGGKLRGRRGRGGPAPRRMLCKRPLDEPAFGRYPSPQRWVLCARLCCVLLKE